MLGQTCRNPWLWLSSATQNRQWDCVDETICTWSVRLQSNACLETRYRNCIHVSVNVQCSGTSFMQEIYAAYEPTWRGSKGDQQFLTIWNFLSILIHGWILQFQINSFLSINSIMRTVCMDFLYCKGYAHFCSCKAKLFTKFSIYIDDITAIRSILSNNCLNFWTIIMLKKGSIVLDAFLDPEPRDGIKYVY